MKLHKETKHQAKIYSCDCCRYKSKWKTSFLEHKIEKHNIYQKKSKHFKNGNTGPVQCESCDFTAQSARRLVMHTNVKHTTYNEYFSCLQCDFIAKSEMGLNIHTLSMHKTVKAMEKVPNTYYCEFCDYVTRISLLLKEHKDAVHEGVKYPCHLCSYLGTTKRNLAHHISSVHKEKRKQKEYSCDLCDYTTKKDKQIDRA